MLPSVLYLFLPSLALSACPEGWFEAPNTDLGCLLFTEDKPADACEGKHMCSLKGTNTDTATGTGDAVVQMVEVKDAAAAEALATYADFADPEGPWWLGMSWVVGNTPGFAWNSVPGTIIDPATVFPDIFTPDDITTEPTINDDLCVVMNVESGKPVWDDVKCFGSSPANLICQCM